MSPTTEDTQAPKDETAETASQSLGTGAAGGAAIGSVVALGFAAGSVVLPLVGGAVGAAGGALLGYFIHRRAEKNSEICTVKK
jgi:uncharacterized membrane protein